LTTGRSQTRCWIRGAAVVALLAVIPALSIDIRWRKSATFDEPINLFHGFQMLATGDVSVPMDYAPLPRIAAAASARLFGPPIRLPPAAWAPGIQPHLAQRVLYLENDADALLLWGRLATLPLHVLLALAVFLVARRLWGFGGGFVALFLCVLSPTVLAHAPLLTADFPVTAFLFLAFALAWEATRRRPVPRLLAAGLALGLALLSKLSALLALPVLALCFGAHALVGSLGALPAAPPFAGRLGGSAVAATGLGGPPGPARRLGAHPVPGAPLRAGAARRWAAVAAAYALVVATALAVVWAAYGFRYHAWRESDPARAEKEAVLAEFRVRSTPESTLQRAGLALAERLRLLPEPYLLTLRFTFQQMQRKLSFFLGKRTIEGNVLYFPVALLLKTPLALLVLLGLAALGLLRGRIRLDWTAAAFFVLFPTLYFGAALFAHINLGHRHLLPIYPFLFVLAGGTVAAVRSRRRTEARLTTPWAPLGARTQQTLLVVLLVWFGAVALRIHPHQLTYFNELAGGPRGGIRYLGDSNLDWGQDLNGVGPWMRRHAVARIKLAYFGTAVPTYYGFAFDWLPSVGFANDRDGAVVVAEGDHLAVSATCLQGFYFQDMAKYRFLDAYEPVDVLGNSMYIYHLVPERRR
jgi:4-amino-4-deoxy-L-arabinose transferase-like glycosyltransferase